MYDVNIEFAHVAPGARNADLSFRKSYSLFIQCIDACLAKSETVSVSILIDDKEETLSVSKSWLLDKLAEAKFHHFDRLFWGTESKLVLYRKALYSLVVPSARDRISNEIERYYRKHGRLACSHDIAIWHLLRLGQIAEFVHIGGRPEVAFDHGHSETAPPLPAGRLISILSDEDYGAEQRAANEIIALTVNGDEILRKMDKIFYSTR